MPESFSILALVVCAYAGYWIISKLWPSGKPAAKPQFGDGERNPNSSPPAYQGQDAGWFDILGVSQFATPDEIRRAYREKINAYHPDRVAGLGHEFSDLAEQKSKTINAAYAEGLRVRGAQ